MVINGRKLSKEGLTIVEFERDRIYLPAQFVERAAYPRLAGKDQMDCWLIVLAPGRFRLVPKVVDPPSAELSRMLKQIDETMEPGEVLDRTQDNAIDGIQARLIPCTVSPPGPGWRINFPREARRLVPENEDSSFAYLMLVAGFIEIWFPDTLRRALSGPIP